jgi:hypothetical protein
MASVTGPAGILVSGSPLAVTAAVRGSTFWSLTAALLVLVSFWQAARHNTAINNKYLIRKDLNLEEV